MPLGLLVEWGGTGFRSARGDCQGGEAVEALQSGP